MSKTVKVVLALILALSAVYGEQIIDLVKKYPVDIVNTPSVDIEEPSLEYKTLVENIVSVDIEPKDAKEFSDFYTQLSDIVLNEPGFIVSTGNFREFNMMAGGLNFAGLELKGKYPSLGQEIDDAIKNTIGLEDSALTDEKRKDLCDCLDAVAWGVHQ
jgi:hypothetical protein